MTCFSPLNGFLPVSGGKLQSVDRGDCRPVSVPCRQCIGCRLDRSRDWAVRCVHEAQIASESCFVTLTYADEFVPRSLTHSHFQLFMHRLRKRLKRSVRFYMSGEYGERTLRPHYHACLFGYSFLDDRVYYRKSPAGSRLYRSDLLDSVWGMGLCSIGELTFESAAYAARYITKKVTGDAASEHYSRVDVETGEVYEVLPEYSKMSLRPGLGAEWARRYMRDCLPRDYCVIDGRKWPVPDYYVELMRREGGWYDLAEVEHERFKRSCEPEVQADSTPERLAVREACARAALSFKSRDLE